MTPELIESIGTNIIAPLVIVAIIWILARS
jgi:hypothetical protein